MTQQTTPILSQGIPLKSLNLIGMIGQSIRYYRWTMLLVAIGAAATTAVMVGALLVGESVRGSMQSLVMDRLGRIDQLLLTPRFIDADSAARMGSSRSYPSDFEKPVPAILFPRGSAEATSGSQTVRAGSILIVGCDPTFWELNDIHPAKLPAGREVVLNDALATELGAHIGDEVTLRMPKEQAVPSDSPLGKREDLSQSLPRLKVVAIVPNKGLGRFDLRASQKPPRNAYLPTELIQETLDRSNQINAILIARKKGASRHIAMTKEEAEQQSSMLLEAMQPSLSDLGLKIERIRKTFPEKKRDGDRTEDLQVPFDYYHVTSDQLLIASPLVQAIERRLSKQQQQPVLTYLANAIEKLPSNGTTVTYSTISAIDAGPTFSFGGIDERDGTASTTPSGQDNSLAAGTVAVNSWLAEQLSLSVGENIRIYYYLPETIHGIEVEKSSDFKVAKIVPVTRPATPYRRTRDATFDKPPTPFNDPALTPVVPGITDQDSISDLPFKLERKVRKEDDEYWDRYRMTPKIFLSLEEGQRLFGSRFGNVSSIRIDPSIAENEESLTDLLLPELRKVGIDVGLKPTPIYWQQKSAASGTTPFDALFLSLSFFVIIAALILISLLFRLGVEQRASQWGLLLALGWPPRRVRRLLIVEGAFVAAIGGLLGVVLGIGYAYLMISGLRGWWVGAVQTAFLDFYVGPQSMLIGWLIGWFASMATIVWSISSLTRKTPLNLLREQINEVPSLAKGKKGSKLFVIAAALTLLALIAIGAGFGWSGEARAGAFLSGAMLLVIAAVLLFHRSLRMSKRSSLSDIGSKSNWDERDSLSLLRMASHSAKRNPTRSTLSVGMIAFASFLVLSISLFQAKPTESAIGGFEYIAESSVPIIRGLSEQSERKLVLGSEEEKLNGVVVQSMRLRPGDDASCNNLYQANQPRVLGLRPDMAERDAKLAASKRFPWAGKDAPHNEAEKASPFAMLEREGDGSQEHPYPVILDQNTAMWSLHQGASIGAVFSFNYDGRAIYFQTVGLMQNALLQGYLLLSEANFIHAFPNINGYQVFLIDDADLKDSKEVVALFESGWGDEGLDLTRASTVLQSLLAVQNTYLSAFQVLGALGLLLGTFGLAVVQMRSVIERRGELALLRAVGYSRARVSSLLLAENSWLLLTGVAIGAGAAMAAVLPAWLGGQSIAEFTWPMTMLLIVVATGLLSGILAAAQAGRQPILKSLRGK